MQKVIKDARGIMNNLRPSILDEMGLIPTIGWLSEEYQKAYSHIRIHKQLEALEKDIPEVLKVVIFRVLQEALNNFAKHGRGNLVELSLLKSGDTLHFGIRDNGQGFDVGNVPKGLGLESMRERVEGRGWVLSDGVRRRKGDDDSGIVVIGRGGLILRDFSSCQALFSGNTLVFLKTERRKGQVFPAPGAPTEAVTPFFQNSNLIRFLGSAWNML